MVPSYREARRGAASAFDAEDALEAGQKFVRSNLSNNDARRAVSKLSEPERKLFAEGFASDLIDQINKVSDKQNVANRIFGSPQARQRVEIALGKDRAREMEAFVRVENMMDTSRRAIQGNSTSAQQFVEAGLMTAGGVTSFYSGDSRGLAAGVLAAALSRGRSKIDAGIARKIAEMLASDDPAIVQKAIKAVGKNTRLAEAVRGAEDYLIKAIGPAANENIAQPLAAPLTSRISLPAAASGSEPKEEPQY